MKKSEPHEKYCSQLAAQAWKKIRASKLAGGKKVGIIGLSAGFCELVRFL